MLPSTIQGNKKRIIYATFCLCLRSSLTHTSRGVKRAVRVTATLFILFLMPDTLLVYSLWNLRNNLSVWMAKLQLCRPSILSNVTKNKIELWKTAIAILFNLLQVCPSVTPFLFVAWFIPYSNFFNVFLKVSLNLAAVPSVWILINFMTQLF